MQNLKIQTHQQSLEANQNQSKQRPVTISPTYRYKLQAHESVIITNQQLLPSKPGTQPSIRVQDRTPMQKNLDDQLHNKDSKQNITVMQGPPSIQAFHYNQAYKVPTKMMSSVAGGLSNPHLNLNVSKIPEFHYFNQNQQLKTQQFQDQFIGSRASQPLASLASVTAPTTEVFPNINYKAQTADENLRSNQIDSSQSKTIPSIYESQNTKLKNNRSISEFNNKTPSDVDNVNQLVLNPKSAVFTKGERTVPNKTFQIKNKAGSRNNNNLPLNNIYVQNTQVEEHSVEANYGLTQRVSMMNRSQHPPTTHLRNSGESHLIQAGKMTTQNMKQYIQQDESDMTKTTPIMPQKTIISNPAISNELQQKYLFNKTAACVSKNQFTDPYSQQNEVTVSIKTTQQEKQSDYVLNQGDKRQFSIQDKINQLNQKLNYNKQKTLESKSLYNAETQVLSNSIFATTAFDQSLPINKKSQNSGKYYTTFNGSIPVAAGTNYGQEIPKNNLLMESKNEDQQNQIISQETQIQNELNENQLKIKKFLNLVDLQELVEKETQQRINQTDGNKVPQQYNSKSQNKPSAFSQSQKNQMDSSIWKHFQYLLQFDQNNSDLQARLTFSQKKTLLSLRAQLLKNVSSNLNQEEIFKSIKQFIESCNLDEIFKNTAPSTKQIKSKSFKQKQMTSTSPTHQGGFGLSHQNSQNMENAQPNSQQQNSINNTSSERNSFTQFNKNAVGHQQALNQKDSQSNVSQRLPQSTNQAKVININKLNINIQQYQNGSATSSVQNGVTGISYNQSTTTGSNSQQQSRNNYNKFTTSSSNYTQNKQGSNVPKHVQDTLFIMDCQLLGLLKHIHLLNLENNKQLPLSLEKDTKLTEAELVHFIMTRANSATSLMFKELPKLSEEAKQIINMIKAQQQVDLQDEITRIETLIIEIDYTDYKNKLLQALFNNYGDSVLETIIHLIQQGPSEIETIKTLNEQHFQTINQYVNSIRKMHQQQSTKQEEMKSPTTHFVTPEFSQTNSVDEMADNLSYLFPNIYDSNLKSLNFTPGFKGKKYKDKKINFGVMVKETKLYHALREADNLTTSNNLAKIGLQAANKMNLSSFLVTHDCTLLRFMLFCSHAGIIRSAQASLRMFFKHVFIVIKPGSQVIPQTGSVVYHSQLPQVDIDKVTNYIQNQLKKKQKQLESSSKQKMMKDEKDGKEKKESSNNVTPAASKSKTGISQQVAGVTSGSTIDRIKSSVSLNSSKSQKQLEIVKIDVGSHFNSLNSSIRTDLAPTAPTTIKIYHKPFTHLDQSKIQKAFKTYNEFVSLTFKNRLIYAQSSGEGATQDISDFSQQQAARICKLGTIMGIKDLPKKHNILRSPLLELFRNHRQLSKIKEQILRFIFRTLNEENEITYNFQQVVLSGFQFNLDKNNNVVLRENEQQLTVKSEADKQTLNLNNAGKQTAPSQKIQFYKYQVGFGNNHFLIKSIMKNRCWWMQATSKDYVSNFDDAPIIWTQWCKTKICNHLLKNQQFKFEFKTAIDKIDAKLTATKAIKQNSDQKLLDKTKVGSASPQKFTDGFNFNKDGRQMKISSRQQKKTSVVLAQQYKSIENQAQQLQQPQNLNLSSPEKVQNTTTNAEASPFGIKSAKKQKTQTNMQLQKQKSTYDDENLSDAESNVDKSNTEDFNLTKMHKSVKTMKEKFQRVYNRLEFNQHLNNKKALFINMRNFYNYCIDDGDVFDTLPLTFHIKEGSSDSQFQKFTTYYQDLKLQCSKDSERKNVWLIKPGENTNRGTGIKVESEFARIKTAVDQICTKYGSDGSKKTVILQKYIDNPLLYYKRKFDIRCFALVTCHNGIMKAYFYRDGYIRTSSKEFTLQNLNNRFIHLVNDAIQQTGEEYGKFETANKLSYQDYQKYLNQTYPNLNVNFERDLITQVRKIVTDTIRATFHLLDSKKRLNSYELFGYDFMFDSNFKPYLIEVNSNPCLEFSSSLLAKIFTAMIDNAFRIAVDPLFPPSTEGFASKKSAEGIDLCPENRFDLIFDERIDAPPLLEKLKKINLDLINEVKALDELENSEEEQEQEELHARSMIDTPLRDNDEIKEEAKVNEPNIDSVEIDETKTLQDNTLSNSEIKRMEEEEEE